MTEQDIEGTAACPHEDAVLWNPWNKVVQCHRCGQRFVPDKGTMTEQELIERLAEKEHASWARWMDYLFSQCVNPVPGGDGSLVIPSEFVRHWKRQIDTSYAALSEREKQMDRDEVAHILPIIRQVREAAYDDVQEFVVLHAIDTTVGRKIDDYITERLATLKAD